MSQVDKNADYNKRLFSRGFRARLHIARFHWCRKTIQRMRIPVASVLELGCFDGKTLKYLPDQPAIYDGYDANWDGGVDIGRAKWRDWPGIKLHKSSSVEDFLKDNNRVYDLSICMETLEHLPRENITAYLSKISEATGGYLLITVPNEIGVMFATKWFYKKLIFGAARRYTSREFICQAFGRVEHVAQQEHKGFSYRRLIKEVEKHFRVVKVEGLPWRRLPLFCSFTIGIVCVPKSD